MAPEDRPGDEDPHGEWRQEIHALQAQVRQLTSDRETVIQKHNTVSKRIIAALEILMPLSRSFNPSLLALRKALAILQGRE